MPPRPSPLAYSCGGAACALHPNACALHPNEAAGAATGDAPQRGGQPAARRQPAPDQGSAAPSPAPPCLSRPQWANSGHSKSDPRFIVPRAAGRSCGAPAARMALTDVTANRLRRNTAASSSSSAPAFLNLLSFLTLTQSCNTGHLLHYHILGEFGEGGREEGSWRWLSSLAFERQREPRQDHSWSPGTPHL